MGIDIPHTIRYSIFVSNKWPTTTAGYRKNLCPCCNQPKDCRSKKCRKCDHTGPTKTMSCKQCLKTMEVKVWRLRQGGGKFCSAECKHRFAATIHGPNHPRYTGRHYTGHYKGFNWKEARRSALERANGKCERCGRSLEMVKRYAVHHCIPAHCFDDPYESHTVDNLTVFCQSCHAKHHGLGKLIKR